MSRLVSIALYKNLILLVLCLGMFAGVASRAHAQDTSAALTRMDEIIKEMLQLRIEFQQLLGTVSGSGAIPSVLGASTKSAFTLPLTFGETNNDIARIQKLLATDPDIYPYGLATGYFGEKTTEAIRNLQSRFGLDPVGVVGPATRNLLERFFAKYPDENFPSTALDTEPPAVPAVTTATTQSTVSTQATTQSTGELISIEAELDHGEAEIKVNYRTKEDQEFFVFADTESEVVKAIAKKIGYTEAQVRAALDFTDDNDDEEDFDDGDAEDAIDDADSTIDDVQDAIDEADDDGDDIDWADDTLDDARTALRAAEDAYDDEDWNEAVDKAEEALELAEDAENRIGKEKGSQEGDPDTIRRIEVEVDDGESDVTVTYKDDPDYEFTIDEDKEDEIIEAIADELDIDESDVEDVIKLDFGDVDSISALIGSGSTKVTVEYESGVKRRFTVSEDDEDSVIAEVSDVIGERESDVEDWIDFDYS